LLESCQKVVKSKKIDNKNQNKKEEKIRSGPTFFKKGTGGKKEEEDEKYEGFPRPEPKT
jgi:hypothetical protein